MCKGEERWLSELGRVERGWRSKGGTRSDPGLEECMALWGAVWRPAAGKESKGGESGEEGMMMDEGKRGHSCLWVEERPQGIQGLGGWL